MRRIFLKLALIIAGIFVYVALINILAYSTSTSSPAAGYNAEARNDGGNVVVGVSDSVDVTVTRHRWYGTILENSGQKTKSAKLYLLNFISIPLYSNGKSMLLINMILLFFIIISLYFIIKWIKKRDSERGFM